MHTRLYSATVVFMNSLNYLVTWATNNGREHRSWCVISGETRLHQSRTVITHQGCSLLVVTHGGRSATDRPVRARARLVPITVVLFFLFCFGGFFCRCCCLFVFLIGRLKRFPSLYRFSANSTHKIVFGGS